MHDRDERTNRRAARGDVAAVIALLGSPERRRIRDALLETASPDELSAIVKAAAKRLGAAAERDRLRAALHAIADAIAD